MNEYKEKKVLEVPVPYELYFYLERQLQQHYPFQFYSNKKINGNVVYGLRMYNYFVYPYANK